MLSPLHKNALLSTFLHIESRLNEMEPLLAQGKRPSPLDQHVPDLSPTEAKVVDDYFARIRSTMVTCLEKHGIPIEVRRVGLRWSLQTSLITHVPHLRLKVRRPSGGIPSSSSNFR